MLCDPRWIRHPDIYSLNGIEASAVKSVKACLKLCQTDRRCVAVDYETDTKVSGCWVHKKKEDLWPNNTFRPQRRMDQYIIDRTCLDPSKCNLFLNHLEAA